MRLKPATYEFYIPHNAVNTKSGHQILKSRSHLVTAPLQRRSGKRSPTQVLRPHAVQSSPIDSAQTPHVGYDASSHHTHRRSSYPSPRKPSRRTTAGQRPSRGEMQQQCLQLPAYLLQFPTYIHSVLLHVVPLDHDSD